MTRAFGWRKPAPEVYGRLRLAGPRASSILADVVPADSADCSNLVQIIDQLNLGSCVANAIAQIVRAAMLFTGAPVTTEFLSRLWAYTLALADEGNLGKDTGTYLAIVMDELATYGFPKESIWPYDPATFGQRPSPECHRSAHDQRAQKATAYHQISETGDARLLVIKQCLTAGKLVAFGTQVDPVAFNAYQPGTVLDIPAPGMPTEGHAMCVVGYEDDGTWKVANSWGEGFGERGFLWMTSRYLAWDETADLWCVSSVPRFSEDAT
jgi:C1A family cysteine protease